MYLSKKVTAQQKTWQSSLNLIKPLSRGGVEDTRLEAKAKNTKKIPGQGQRQPFREQNLTRPRTGMLKAKDQGHRRKCSPKKKGLQNFFQAISNSLAYPEFLIGGSLNHKSHVTMSQKFFQKKVFVGQRYRRMEDLKSLLPACT